MRDKSQDRGLYEFISLASPDDRIAAHFEDDTHYLTMICVHRKSLPIGHAAEEKRAASPSVNVVAKWTSAD